MPTSEHQKRYIQAIREARTSGMASFQSWFNEASDVQQAIVRGYWDFAVHILTPKVCELLSRPEERTALEIGCGGGRLLNAACSFFAEAIGIDIHDETEMVDTFLRSQGKRNFRLIRTSGDSLDVEDESVDFVYSFIVLQHLPSYDALSSYIKETARCLKPHGVAQLYFGRLSLSNQFKHWRSAIAGYLELPDVEPNRTSLLVRTGVLSALCREAGLDVVGRGHSYKRVPDGFVRLKGGQGFVTAAKTV